MAREEETYSGNADTDMRTYDEVVLDIANCGTDTDICCLADDVVFDKVARWLRVFGRERTRKLIRLACVCKERSLPPKRQPAEVTGTPVIYKIPSPPPPAGPYEPPPYEPEPQEPAAPVCDLPPRGQFSNSTTEVA